MKNPVLKSLFVALAFMLFGFNTYSQNFEGIIEFKKMTLNDTTEYTYAVKGNKVRIDEIGSKSKKAEGTFLIDLDAKTMISLNHERKLFMDKASPAAPVIKGTCEVKKGTATKQLQGYKCTEYSVTNNEENTKIVYYIADGKFTFFDKLLNLLNRRDKPSVYFLQIKGVQNVFPMLSIQSDVTGVVTGSLEATKVTAKSIDASMFAIPKDYKKFEK